MNRADLVNSIFHPIRITGKNWSSLSEIQKYASEVIGSAAEKRIPRNFTLYGHYDLNFNYPVTLSLNNNCDDCTDEYHLERNLDVVIIDDQQMVSDLKVMLKSRGFKMLGVSDVQIILRDMGIKGYLSSNGQLVIMNPREYIMEKLCGCGGDHSQDDKLCGCGGGHHRPPPGEKPYCGCGDHDHGW